MNFEKIAISAISRVTGVIPTEISSNSSLIKDLSLTDQDLQDIVGEINIALHSNMDIETKELKTVQDLILAIESHNPLA